MLTVKNKLVGKINAKNTLKGKLNNAINYVYPPLIDLEVTPSGEEQIFNHEGSYGYDNVTIKKIEDKNLISENIKDGVDILGVTGNYSGSKYAPRYITFYNYSGTDLDEEIVKLDTSNMTSMKWLFYYCQNLTSLNLSGFDTSKVTNMENMFSNCSNLTSLDISNFNTSNVTTMRGMFQECRKLTMLNVDDFNTSNVTDMYYMFYQCQALTSLDLSGFNTSKVTNMNGMFYYCQNLTSLNLSGFDTSKVTNMYGMFYRCSKITTLAELDASSCTDIRSVLDTCSNLENFGGFKNLGQAYSTTSSANYNYYKLDLSKATKLTHDSLMNVINNLYDIKTKGCNTQALTLGSTNLAKLTEEEIAIATNKGWTVS